MADINFTCQPCVRPQKLLNTAEQALAQEMKDFPVTPSTLLEKFQLGRYPRVFHSGGGSDLPGHIFEEMYRVPESIRLPYLKIKVLELLLYLQAMELPAEAESPYFYRTQVEKVKAIRAYLAADLAASHTQIENADQILVLDDGRIVQRGTHAQLVQQEGRYQQFVRIREKAEGWNLG